MATQEIENARNSMVAEAKAGEYWGGKTYLGKYGSELDEAAYILSFDGGDESTGSVEAYGYFTLFRDEAVVLCCDSQGFAAAWVYDTVADAEAVFAAEDKDFAAWLSDDDEPREPVTDDPELPRGTFVTVDTASPRGVAWEVLQLVGDEVMVQMVGDDRPKIVCREDVTVIDDDSVCSCGAIGCFYSDGGHSDTAEDGTPSAI